MLRPDALGLAKTGGGWGRVGPDASGCPYGDEIPRSVPERPLCVKGDFDVPPSEFFPEGGRKDWKRAGGFETRPYELGGG